MLSAPHRTRFRRISLFGKLLVPLMTVSILLGAFGVFLVIRDLSARAESALEQDLARRSLDARSLLRDRELYLLESVNFAANLQGVTEGIRDGKSEKVAGLMQSVLALKTDLDLLVATDERGVGVVEFVRNERDASPQRRRGTAWATDPMIAEALRAGSGIKTSGFTTAAGEPVLAIAAPVCSQPKGCRAVGVAIAGIRVSALAQSVRGLDPEDRPSRVGAALYDQRGRLLASAGLTGAATHPPALPIGEQVRETKNLDGEEIGTVYAPLDIGGRRMGTLAVSVPTDPAFASVRGARLRLAFLLLATLVAAVGVGALISRLILRQVRPLIETNRSLGRGDLDARAPVLSQDELGELAHGINQMAEQLQAIYGNLELRVEQRTEEVRRLLQERTEFFAALSHELRTPLAVIVGQGQIILDPKIQADRRKTSAATKTIIQTAEQLITLVNEILELVRAETGRIDVDLDDVDLSSLVHELRPTIEALARGSGLSVDITMPRELPTIRADRRRVREIMVNLVDNAVKYTPAGGTVAVSASTHNGTVDVSVADSGIGIPPENGDLVFEPFYRVKGTDVQGGQASTGLGLALAKRLVEAQGGRIWYASSVSGTTFTFSLPRTTAGSPAAPTPAHKRRTARP